jgi:hypothetical protein
MEDFGLILFIIVAIAVCIFMIAAMWKVFEKAGQPGWGVLIPIYNIYLLLVIAGKPGWWIILFLIPLVNFVIAIIVYIDLAKNFGKDALFGLGLAFLGIIFWPILGFGNAQYQGAAKN